MSFFFIIFTPREFFNALIQFKTSSDSNKFFIFDIPMHWLAKSKALIEQDLSPGIFITLLNFLEKNYEITKKKIQQNFIKE